MKSILAEEDLENISIEWFKEIGYQFIHGPNIAPDSISPERHDLRQVFLIGRLKSALIRLNPEVPSKTIDAAVLQITNPNIPGLIASNRQFHKWMTKGLPLSYMNGNQEIGIRLKIIDFDNPDQNDWLVVNQLAISGPKNNRRPDVVVYINGLPIAVIELKNPANEKTNIWKYIKSAQGCIASNMI